MHWLYRVQQRLALTRSEGVALLVFTALLLSGEAARHLWVQPPPLPPGIYSEADSLLRHGAAAVHAAAAHATAADTAPHATAADTLAPTDGTMPLAAAPASGRVPLNTATAAELERLPRIGPKMAARILAYREAHGPFTSVAALQQVRGIGAKTLAQLRPLVTIAPDTLPHKP